MSAFRFNCSQCGQLMTADEAEAGMTTICPKCSTEMTNPEASGDARPGWLMITTGDLRCNYKVLSLVCSSLGFRGSTAFMAMVCTVAFLASTGNRACAEMLYMLTELPAPAGSESWASGINNTGQVIGCYHTNGGPNHAYIYSSGTMIDLGTLGGRQSWANGLNDSGCVVGSASTASEVMHAFQSSGRSMLDLCNVCGDANAVAINNQWQIVGYRSWFNNQQAFLYFSGSFKNLGTLGGNDSFANAINDKGQITGFSSIPNGLSHAFLYQGGKMTDLGTLPGYDGSEGFGINSNGQIAGYAYFYTNNLRHAFLYDNGVMRDLGTLSAFSGSTAWGINNKGQIVGCAFTENYETKHAFLYENGCITDLNSRISTNPGLTLVSANAINDNGQIAGSGINILGLAVAFVLTPISQSGPGPLLSVSHSKTNLILSWSTNADGFSLFRNSTLQTGTWVAVTNAPVATNDEYQLVIPGPLAGSCFFRLQCQ